LASHLVGRLGRRQRGISADDDENEKRSDEELERKARSQSP
jgi:hypothetical protein